MIANDVRTRTQRRPKALGRIAVVSLVSILTVPLTAGIAPKAVSAAVPNPTVTGPITGGCSPLCPSPPGPTSGIHIPDMFGGESNNPDLAKYGYVENEYFFEGTASAFERDPTAPAWDSTGQWTARPSTTIAPAAYKTRMRVIQPADPANFNGTVVVEWFNVTAGLDTPPDYAYAHEELLRGGYIWVGVSAQSVSVNGSPLIPGFGLKSFDPVRYGSLVHPGDSFSYDIYSQAAQAIRNPVGVNPLGSSAYVVTRMIADGESQSASRMVTYINAIQPLAQLYDGFFVHSRGASGAALFAPGGTVPGNSNIRTDQVPVLVFETETDTVGHFNARQPDGTNYRLWEPAGTAHADLYSTSYITQNQANQVPFYPPIVCTFPYNSAGQHYLVNAALVRLTEWITDGTPPPSAPPITVVAGVIQRDAFGIALGGIRLPEMDVPTQTQTGVGNLPGLFCGLFGRTLPLPVPVSSLYTNHGKYVSPFVQATNDLRKAGFLLDPDAEELKMLAAESDVP